MPYLLLYGRYLRLQNYSLEEVMEKLGLNILKKGANRFHLMIY